MTKLALHLSGIFSRSEELIQAGRDFDRHRISEIELQNAYDQDSKRLIQWQQDNDFEFIHDGQLTWHDEYRPLIFNQPGIKMGALVRYFDTNTFYRQGLIQENAYTLHADTVRQYFYPIKRKVVSLPGPVTFNKMMGGSANTLDYVQQVLLQVIDEMNEVPAIQLQEPWLAYHSHVLEKAEMKSCMQCLASFQDKVLSLNKSITLMTHFPFGDAAPFSVHLEDLPSHVIGIDFYQTDLQALSALSWDRRDLMAACINGRNSLIEEPEAIRKFVLTIIDKLSPKKIYLTNNVDLRFVPQKLAYEKLFQLVKVKEILI